MNTKRWIGMVCLMGAAVMGAANVSAAGKAAPQTPLTADGEKLLAKYSAMLTSLQAEVGKALPKIDESKKAAFLKAREAA